MLDNYAPLTADYAAAASALHNNGWCLLSGLVPSEQVAAFNADLDPIYEATPFCDGDFYGNRTKRFGSLLKRSPHAAAFVLHSTIMALVRSSLGPWCDTIQLNLAQAIELHPGAPLQYPHRDQDMWQGVKGEVEYLVNVMWPLTCFTRSNGATQLYPGTHGAEALIEREPQDPLVAACDPGSAIVFLGSTLHGAGANLSSDVRRGVLFSYCLGWLKPYENQWLAYPPPVARRFSPELAALVGYAQHRPNLGNYEGVCPSILLGDHVPEHIGAVDALRPDQRDAVSEHRSGHRHRAVADPTPCNDEHVGIDADAAITELRGGQRRPGSRQRPTRHRHRRDRQPVERGVGDSGGRLPVTIERERRAIGIARASRPLAQRL